MDQYEYGQDIARAGMVFGLVTDVENMTVPSGVTFEFGEAVFVDEGNETDAFKPDSTDTSLKFLGISMLNHRCTKESEEQYLEYREMDVLVEGEIYVPVASGITNCANQLAYVVDATGSTEYKEFTTVNNANTYAIGGYFRSNVNADGLARVELRGLN
jgi:hypothetical protein